MPSCLLVSPLPLASVWPLFHRVSLSEHGPRISFPWFHRLEGNVDLAALHLQKPSPARRSQRLLKKQKKKQDKAAARRSKAGGKNSNGKPQHGGPEGEAVAADGSETLLMRDFFRLTNSRVHVKMGWNLDLVGETVT
eukprot:SAG22_NODE_3561_length_1640_cov_3.143413_1_plen_137_part_00